MPERKARKQVTSFPALSTPNLFLSLFWTNAKLLNTRSTEADEGGMLSSFAARSHNLSMFGSLVTPFRHWYQAEDFMVLKLGPNILTGKGSSFAAS